MRAEREGTTGPRPDPRDAPPFSRRDWNAMDLDAKRAWIERVTREHDAAHDVVCSLATRRHDEPRIPDAQDPRGIEPRWIAGFYCDCPMPQFALASGRTRYIVDPEDVFVAAVEYEDDGRRFRLSWNGYASRHYDGCLILYPVRSDAFAECLALGADGETSHERRVYGFLGAAAVDGVCPGFLSVRPRYSAVPEP